MRIYKRDDAWYLDYSFNGRRIRKRIGNSRQEAELALLEVKRDILNGTHVVITEPPKNDGFNKSEASKEDLVFDNLCDEYLEHSRANKAAQSHRRDQVSIKNLLKAFGKKLTKAITAHDLERYKNKRRQAVKPATVNRELSCIKHMFNMAIVWGYLESHQLHQIRKFKEPAGIVRYLKDDEIKRLLDICPRYLKPIVVMALNTGMRKSEILNLKWADVDMINKIITVRNSKNNESRILPINPDLYDELSAKEPNANGEYVFCHHDGSRFHEIYYGFQAALKRAGIANFRFHDLRHTFASRLAMNGENIKVIQELMGHKSIIMTIRYSHLSKKTLQDAVAKLCLNRVEKSDNNMRPVEKTENDKYREIDTKNGTKVGTNVAQAL